MKKDISINSKYNEHNDDHFEVETTISELEQALKVLPPTGSFDIDKSHFDSETFGLPSQASCPLSI